MDKDIGQQTFGETAEHAWMLEFLDRCFPESGDRVSADLNLASAMCKAEPKAAQVTMQFLAQDIRAEKPDPAGVAFFRFALGVLFMAYAALANHEGRCGPDKIPPELKTVIEHYPEIIECANSLGPIS